MALTIMRNGIPILIHFLNVTLGGLAGIGGDTSNRASGPLSGMRIIDMTSVLMGPYATQMLGDYGADVIKVESPEGDLMRLGRRRDAQSQMGSIYLQANRNKRSIVLDVKTEAGRNALLELCRTADALIHNVRTAAMARLRLTYEDIRAVNAEIVYTALVGYGENGPYAGKPAYDDLIQGISAIPSLFSQGGRSEPRFVPINIADRIVGLNAAHAILAALLCREQTGKGQSVEVPMFETMTQFVLGDHFGGLSFVPPEGPAGYIGSFPRIAALQDQGRLSVRARLYRQAVGELLQSHRATGRVPPQPALFGPRNPHAQL